MTTTTAAQSYRFAGRTLLSRVPFPELNSTTATADCWTIEFTETPLDAFLFDSVVEQDGRVLVRESNSASGVTLRFDDNAEYELDMPAGRIHVRLTTSVSIDDIRHDLLDQVLPRMLSASGAFLVHASGVLTENGAILFLGPSGAGKSSFAAHLGRQPGIILLGDDCFVVRLGTPITAESTYRSLRLLPDTVRHLDDLGDQALATAAMSPGSPKQRVRFDDEAHIDEVPLAAVVVLADVGDAINSTLEIVTLSQRDLVVALVKNSFRVDVTGSASLGAAFDDAASIAEQTPGYVLTYPRRYDRLTEVCALVLGQVGDQGLT